MAEIPSVTSPYGKATVIIGAHRNRDAAHETPIKDLISSTGLDHHLTIALRPGHAEDIAREAISNGCRYLIAVGDDGTLHEVVNGMMDASEPLDSHTVLAVVPDGAGSDFIRTFGLPSSPADAVGHLLGEPYFQVDIGRVTFQTESGRGSRYFVNVAQVGFGGDVVRRAAAMPRSMGRFGYLLGFWTTLARFKPPSGVVGLGNRTYQGPVTNVVIANGQFSARGMRIAPKAHPADGKFDVLVQKGNKRDYIESLTKASKGDHLPSPAIKEYHAKRAEISAGTSLQIEADGRVLGTTPATFEVVENAFRLKI